MKKIVITNIRALASTKANKKLKEEQERRNNEENAPKPADDVRFDYLSDEMREE